MLTYILRSSLTKFLGFSTVLTCSLGISGTVNLNGHDNVSQIWSVRDHGVMAPVGQIRGRFIMDTEEGPVFVSALRDVMPGGGLRVSLFIMNLSSGDYNQYFHPSPDLSTGDIFCLLPTSRGTISFMTGNDTFRVFDLKSREFTFVGKGMQGLAMSLTEAADGRIFVATFPGSRLFAYDPDNHKITELVRLHDTQQYPLQMLVGNDGWVYVGLGYAEASLVAYELISGTLRILDTGSEPRRGVGMLVRKADDTIAGRLHSGEPWRKLENGQLTDIIEAVREPDNSRRSVFWNNRDQVQAYGYTIESFDVERRVLRLRNPEGVRQEWPFSYESFGASISAMAVAPDGRIIGASDHPNQIWSYNPENGQSQVHGGIPALGGGSLTRFAAYENYLISNSYPLGNVYALDTNRDINPGGIGRELNPEVIAQTNPWIGRPRVMHRHSSGKHLISAGFPAYGQVGGGMLIYNLEKKAKERIIQAEDLIPGQTVMSLAELPNGDLVLVSSIHTPGGGRPVAERAEIIRFDWSQQTPVQAYRNIPQTQSFAASALIDGRYLHLVTRDDQYHLYDLKDERTLVSQNLSQHGRAAARRGDTAFVETQDGRLLLVTSKSLLEVEPQSGSFIERAKFPFDVLDVGPVFKNRLYLGAAGNMLSVQITSSED
jgi:hypothetical protein